MTVLDTLGLFSKTLSIIVSIKSLKGKSTAAELLTQAFSQAVQQNRLYLARSAPPAEVDPAEVDVDTDTFVTLLKDIEISDLVFMQEAEALEKIIEVFRKCLIVPKHQLTENDLEQRLRPLIKQTFDIFLQKLPHNQSAVNETLLGGQKHITGYLGGIDKRTQDIQSSLNVDTSAAIGTVIEKEHRGSLDNAKDFLKEHKPQTAFRQLEKLKQRIWHGASDAVKFSILTSMAVAKFALSEKEEAAKLIFEASQYGSKTDVVLSNCATAHASVGEWKEAEEYAEKAIEKNHANIQAHSILIEIPKNDKTLQEVVDKVPEYLRKEPQIANAISNVARRQRDFEKAREWGEISIASDHENNLDFKVGLAAILIEEVLEAPFAMYAQQLSDLQQGDLKWAVELLTEAWDSVSDTELPRFRTDWVLNRSMAYYLLVEFKKAAEDIDTALGLGCTDPVVKKNRAILAFRGGDTKTAIEFWKKIKSAAETPEAHIGLAGALSVDKRHDEAITVLRDFLRTNPSTELQESANHLLVQIYINAKHFEEAQQLSISMLESSPTSVLNLVNAARVSSAIGKSEDALFQLKQAYVLVQNSDVFHEIVEVVTELGRHEQFREAAVLYEKLADTSQNSHWTEFLIYSYYHSGQAARALEVCQKLRKRYGSLKNLSKVEYDIYQEIGGLKQARKLAETYFSTFPDDVEALIDLAYICYRSDDIEELNSLLDRTFDLEALSLWTCFNLVYLYYVASKPRTALDVMYETRRKHCREPEVHLKYIVLFFQVEKQLDELLKPNRVQPDTAVCVEASGQSWYIIEKRADADITRNERDVEDPLVQQLLGKTLNDEIHLGENPLGSEIGTITAIESKYVYAYEESFKRFSEMFPGTPGLWSVPLGTPAGTSEDNSDEAGGHSKIQPILDVTDKQYEESLQIEKVYKEKLPPIGVLANRIGRNVLGTWGFLTSKPDLGLRCSVLAPVEQHRALALLADSQPKLVLDIISLMTLHCLEVADTVLKTFGKLTVAQSTIDLLMDIIDEQKGMWSQREGISPWKEDGKYIVYIIKPEDVKQHIEYLENFTKWIRENCEIQPCTAALQMNSLRKQELDNVFQPFFIDTLLIASQPGYLLFSDDERLRLYAKTSFKRDAETDFHIDGVWTQAVLVHCANNNFLSRDEYNKAVIKLICLNYYHIEFDANVLIEAAKQAEWKPSEPYINLVQTIRSQPSALDIAVDFLFQLWNQTILPAQSMPLTLIFRLFQNLTFGQETGLVMQRLENRIRRKFILDTPFKRRALLLIQEYIKSNSSQIYRSED